jgi:hypothetical protein
MLSPAGNRLTLIRPAIRPARHVLCHVGSLSKYSVIFSQGLLMVYRLFRVDLSPRYHHSLSPLTSLPLHTELLHSMPRMAQMIGISSSTDLLVPLICIRVPLLGHCMVSRAREWGLHRSRAKQLTALSNSLIFT